MSSRFHNSSLIALLCLCHNLALGAQSSPFSSEFLGQCFLNSEEVLKRIRGSDEPDENVTMVQSSDTGDKYWIIDKTGGHNYQWYYVEKEHGTRPYCVTLYIPFAYEAQSRLVNGVSNIEAKTQPSPGGKGYEMIFRKSIRLRHFVPVSCYEKRDQSDQKNVVRREIDCLQVGD